jgi:DNA-binding MarR family transcriptional regulator
LALWPSPAPQFGTEKQTALIIECSHCIGFTGIEQEASVSSLRIETLRLCWLEALVTVADTENISEAARRLGISQPTVSRYLQALTKWSGHELLKVGSISDPDDPRLSVGLTEQGRKLANLAQTVLADLSAERTPEAIRLEITIELEAMLTKMWSVIHSGDHPILLDNYSNRVGSISSTFNSIRHDASLNTLRNIHIAAKGLFNNFEVDFNRQKKLKRLITETRLSTQTAKRTISAKDIRVP